MTPLHRAFIQHDRAMAQLVKAEQNLKAQVKQHARANGLLATPRPETIRAQLGL